MDKLRESVLSYPFSRLVHRFVEFVAMKQVDFTTHIVTAPKVLSEEEKKLLLVAQKALHRDWLIRRPDLNRRRDDTRKETG